MACGYSCTTVPTEIMELRIPSVSFEQQVISVLIKT